MSIPSAHPASHLQKHAPTAIASLITAAVVFLAQSAWNDRIDKADGAVLREQITALTTQVIELRSDIKAMQGNYTMLTLAEN